MEEASHLAASPISTASGWMGAIALADVLRRRWQLALAATAGLLPGVGWIAHASAHLLAPNTNDWSPPGGLPSKATGEPPSHFWSLRQQPGL